MILYRRPYVRPTPVNEIIYGEKRIAAFSPILPFYTFGCLKNVDGFYYFGAMGRSDQQRNPFIYKYDPAKNQVTQVRRISIGVATEDTHRVPTLTCDADGHIYVCCETLTDVEHGTNILIYKTTVVGDLTTLALYKTITGRFAYPLIELSGNNGFVCARGTTNTVTFIRGDHWYMQSSDRFANISAAVQWYDSGNENLVAYVQRLQGHDGNIYLVLNERDNTLNTETFIAVVKGSFGSNVWTNISGSFSKNVSSSGPITRAEIRTNCMVLDSIDYNTENVFYEGGIVKSDGTIKLLISKQTATGNVYLDNPEVVLDELRFYTYSGGWNYNLVDIPANVVSYWTYERYIQLLNSNESFDDIIFIDPLSNMDVYFYRSSDNFVTQTNTLKQAGDGKFRLGSFPYNITSANDYFLVLVSTPGDKFEIYNEGPEDFSNLFLIYRP